MIAAGAARITVLGGGARSMADEQRRSSRSGRTTATPLDIRANIVSHRYLEAMDIRILRGRSFASSDGPQRRA